MDKDFKSGENERANPEGCGADPWASLFPCEMSKSRSGSRVYARQIELLYLAFADSGVALCCDSDIAASTEDELIDASHYSMRELNQIYTLVTFTLESQLTETRFGEAEVTDCVCAANFTLLETLFQSEHVFRVLLRETRVLELSHLHQLRRAFQWSRS